MGATLEILDRKILVETLISHSLAYSFLSRVFYQAPDSELIATLVANRLFDDWPMESEEPETQAGLAMLRQFCEVWDDSLLPSLKVDFARLFIGPDKLLAPPWESVYLSPDHLMFEKQTLEVRQAYKHFNMEAPIPGREPDDHIGLELRFVAHLCNIGLNAVETERIDQLTLVTDAIRDFLKSHLTLWSGEFAKRVVIHGQTDYYRGTAKLLQGCVETSKRAFQLVGE